MLLSAFAVKYNIPYLDVLTAAMSKKLPATLMGKLWTIDDALPDVKAWLQTNHPDSLTTIKRSDFTSRFTDAEKQAIAANPKTLVMWLHVLEYDQINLASPVVKDGIDTLVSLNVITEQRAAELLG